MSVVTDRLEELRDVLSRWVGLVSDYEFIDDDQYAPAPGEPYITYSLVTGLVRQGTRDVHVYRPEVGKTFQVGTRAVTTSLKARGRPYNDRDGLLRATDMLLELNWSMDRPEVVALFDASGFVILRDEQIVETTVTEDGVTIPRATMDLLILMTIEEEIALDYIENVELRGTLITQEGEEIELDESYVMEIPEEG